MPKSKIKVLLLEGLHPDVEKNFRVAGYENLDIHTHALSETELLARIPEVSFIGIRSRTKLTEAVLKKAKRLLGIGCFCIGTNQVDLLAAQNRGIPVFNAPFSNTRSVAELVLGEIIFLLRDIPAKNAAAHRGEWQKTAEKATEVRGKTLGIIGYGHIGTQLSILAEAIGMRVIFHDIEQKLPLGNGKQVADLNTLLTSSDVVSLHVPQTEVTKNMIGKSELSKMKTGSFLVNAAHGNVVDIPALLEALSSGHLLGAALDVFPDEPSSKKERFHSPLCDFENVILTPHIGGSTLEAQKNIGQEVSQKLISYSDNGTSESAVNFPNVHLPQKKKDTHRILHIHHNIPGVMGDINALFSGGKINISAQYLQTNTEIGYVVIDLDSEFSETILEQIKVITGTIRARLLY